VLLVGHFSSKEDLIAEASARALMRSLALLSKLAQRTHGDPLSAVADAYLTSRHHDNPGAGCLLAALGPDVSRQGPAVRHSVTDYVRAAVGLLATLVRGKSTAGRRRNAISTHATLVGTMVMARAVDDRALSQEILDGGLASSKPDAANRCALGLPDAASPPCRSSRTGTYRRTSRRTRASEAENCVRTVSDHPRKLEKHHHLATRIE